MIQNNKYYNFRTVFSVILTLLFLWLLVSDSTPLANIRNTLESGVVHYHSIPGTLKNSPKDSEITIVYIDKQSLAKHGAWPWSGLQFRILLNRLINNGAAVIAFDIPISLLDQNNAQQVYDWLNKKRTLTPRTARALKKAIIHFDYNTQLAKRLKQQTLQQNVVLGVKFTDEKIPSIGYLPSPLQFVNKFSLRSIPNASSYVGNIRKIQQSHLVGGFINVSAKQNSLLYKTPLLVRYGGNIYPALSLQLAINQLLTDKVFLRNSNYDADSITGINLDESWIPTDSKGNISFRFLGPPGTFPAISASKIVGGQLSQNLIDSRIRNKSIIISSNIPHIRTRVRVSNKFTYNSAEIHANVVHSILGNQIFSGSPYLKSLDAWLLVFTGLILALILPGMNTQKILLTAGLFITGWFIYHSTLISSQLYISTLIIPTFLIVLLSLFHYMANLDSVKLRMLPVLRFIQDLIPILSPNDSTQAERAQISQEDSVVMFVDIRSFSIFAEQLNVVELNKLLGLFSTPISSVIMRHQGQITQHIGHSILATWSKRNNIDAMSDAIDAAIKIGRISNNLRSTMIKKELPDLEIDIGINSGSIKTRSLTWQSRLTCGQAVDSACQLSDLCKFYGVNVIVTEKAKDLSHDFYFRQLDTIKIAGSLTPTTIYEPISRTADIDLLEYYELQLFERAMEYIHEANSKHAISFFSYLHKARPDTLVYKRYLDELKNDSLGDKEVKHSFLNKRINH